MTNVMFIFASILSVSNYLFASQDFDAILKVNSDQAGYFDKVVFPLGSSRDGKIALYSQFGKECKYSEALKLNIAMNVHSEDEDEPIYICQAEAVYEFTIVDLIADRVLVKKMMNSEKCGPFKPSLVKAGQKKTKDCNWVTKEEILEELKKHQVALDSKAKLEEFPLKKGELSFEVILDCLGSKKKKNIKNGIPYNLAYDDFIKFGPCTKHFGDQYPNISSEYDAIRAKAILKRSDGKLKEIGTTEISGSHNFHVTILGYYQTLDPNRIAVFVTTSMGGYHGGSSFEPHVFGAKLNVGFK